ncbi:hypothetical protein [uncultured Piscinibacter sp.]|uniref:hypothetical protein n=1 Tax=uncultured Piscinibacter sp. TaxID=1131835 RepID=UPI0026051851|nr:hypothetical protein [uncultured Piscinibacter sp.]
MNFRIQRLFVVAIGLKVISAGIGWFVEANLLKWAFSFVFPMVVMGLYVVLGLKRRDTDVSDEKFADSCYYLGFIFTISAIIFSLFDLPNIGTKMQDIAVRFGAAMVSTVVGLCVRVYLVSFRKDAADAIKEAEDGIVDASHRLREQMVLANERLRDFHSAVDVATKETVERVRQQLETLAQQQGNNLQAFFEQLTEDNQAALTQTLEQVRAATQHLSTSVDGYAQGMRANLESIETKVTAFADAVTQRLRNTTFPDDFFVQRLQGPLQHVHDGTEALSRHVQEVASSVQQTSRDVNAALNSIGRKTEQVDGALDHVLHLTKQQQAVLDASEGQLQALQRVEETLGRFDGLLAEVIAQLKTTSGASSEVVARVSQLVDETTAARKSLKESLDGITAGLAAQTRVGEQTTQQLSAAAKTAEAAASQLRTSGEKQQGVSEQQAAATRELVALASAGRDQAAWLHRLGEGANAALTKVEAGVRELSTAAASLRVSLASPPTLPLAPSPVLVPAPVLAPAVSNGHSVFVPEAASRSVPPPRPDELALVPKALGGLPHQEGPATHPAPLPPANNSGAAEPR